MHTELDCVPCFVRQALDAARAASTDPRVHEVILRNVLRRIAEMDLRQSPPVMGQAIQRHLRAVTGSSDPYREAKQNSNRLALEVLPELAARVAAAEDPLFCAARCAVAANAIDMGAASILPEAEVQGALRAAPDLPVHGDWQAFRQALAAAREILYLADNAGEIAVDRLVVERLGPGRVTVVVRGAPVLNDATLDDARAVGLTERVEVIDNGSDAPGTLLDACSPEFRSRFARADLIIAKGQGNFETLHGVQDNIAFWFKVKCALVSRRVALPLGSLVVLPPGAAARFPEDGYSK